MSGASLAVPPNEAVAAAVIALISRLRQGGLSVSTSEAIDAISALNAIGVSRRQDVKVALKSTLVKDPSRDVLFERSFDAVFPRSKKIRDSINSDLKLESDDELMNDVVSALRGGDEELLQASLEESIDRFAGANEGRSSGHHTQRALRRMNVADLYRRYLEQDTTLNEMERALQTVEATAAMEQMKRRIEDLISGRIREVDGVSQQQIEDTEDRPLLEAGPDELAAMRSAMRPLVRRLAAKLSSKKRRGTSSLDMRKTIRSSMGTGGVPVNPVMRQKRPTKPDLVVICDVSGSTAQFAPFTLTLLHAVHQEFRRVRSFVFIDGIVEISELLENSPGVLDPHLLLSNRGLIVKDGRSDYQRAFATFIENWGSFVTAKTTVIIAGDTRSHNRPPATKELHELQHRSRRLYWLNPEPQHEWDSLDSLASTYGNYCTQTFEVSTLRQLISAVTQIV